MSAARLSMGELIRRGRHEHEPRLTQVQLAALTGIPQSKISRLENNDAGTLTKVELSELAALSKHLDVPLQKLQAAARRGHRDMAERVADLEDFAETLAREFHDLKSLIKSQSAAPGGAAP